MKKSISVVLMVVLSLASATAATFALATPIVDGTGILDQPLTWDAAPHGLEGLQIERGDGFVNFVLPRSPDNTTGWYLHPFVTFIDAAVAGVSLDDDFFNTLEGNWDDGVVKGTPPPYDDEVDWSGDVNRVTPDAANNARGVTSDGELEFWVATNSARDAFIVNLTYGFCPRMKIELVPDDNSNYGGAEDFFEIGTAVHEYGSVIPLSDCELIIIDIKPGGYPNSINLNGNGVIPVAILGSDSFDVAQIDVSTVSFAGLDVRVKGNGDPQCSIKDVSGANMPYGEPDGYDDLVCQFVDDTSMWTPDNGTATVTGNLLNGTPFTGSDSINLVPQ